MKRPQIVIPVIDQDVKNYTKAALAAGMDPVVISAWPGSARKKEDDPKDGIWAAEEYDGLLLPGGGDIDPCRYGQENRGSMAIREDLDRLQFAVLEDFVKCGKPVLGICRGHQVINVYFGGTMIQDLPTAARHIRTPDGKDGIHGCVAGEGSWLEKLYGRKFFHNSSHHQAVDSLGEGLIADGFCLEDGTVEAMHHQKLPVYSVQWHPERMCLDLERSDMVNGLPVLEFFCRVCAGTRTMRVC